MQLDQINAILIDHVKSQINDRIVAIKLKAIYGCFQHFLEFFYLNIRLI